ncbi:MAG: aldo/keto reductase [Candidatus Binataceae bacterium]
MLKNRATAEATADYARRFSALPGNYRTAIGLTVASIGIGTYLGENDAATDRAYQEAVKAALLGGINLVDTAVNYRLQRSERSIGMALAELAAAGKIRREEILVATKGGYLTFDGEVPANPRTWFSEKYLDTGIIEPADLVEGSHCIAPGYIEAMIEISRANLGLETIDIYYLHNPESQLGSVDRSELTARIRRVFELLERKVAEGAIAVYGTATWNGYRVAPDDRSYLSLDEMVRAAQEVGGQDHHFRAIQLPFNLAMPEALSVSNQRIKGGQATVLQAAHSMGVAVCASASLLQGRLTRGLPPVVAEAFSGLKTDAQRALQFVRSTPGIDVALVGMKSAEHVREILETAMVPPAPFDAILKLFRRAEE